MNRSLVLCALLVARGLVAQENVVESHLSQEDPDEVSLCLQMHATVPPPVVLEAESTASQIFEDIGVRLHWSCKAPVVCDNTHYILVRVQDHTPDFQPTGALAVALPFARAGVRITIFYDRFTPTLERQAGSVGVLFGHTLAHELGHILAGHDGHSGAGLMRPVWEGSDFLLMQSRSLAFTPEFRLTIKSHVERHNRQ